MATELATQNIVAVNGPPRMTYEEYLALPNEGRLIEWVNGEVIYHMPPLEIHQRIVTYLTRLLGNFIEFMNLGRLYVAPFEMKCRPDGSSREPDVLFVSVANLNRIGDKRLDGPADLIVEVVSDDSVGRDFDEKFIEYQECGVQEYWIVDPRPRRKRALFYQRGADGLFEAAKVENGIYRSKAIPAFWLKVAWLWEMPDAQLTFAEIVGFSDEVVRALKERKA